MLEATTDLTLELPKGSDSGEVLVRWDDQSEVHDLYSPDVGSTTLQFDGARRWLGRLYRSRPDAFWLQFRQGVREGTLIRLQIGGAKPSEWTGGALASLLPRDERIARRLTDHGLAFRVEQPEISIQTRQPWHRSSRRDRLPRFLFLWSVTTATISVLGHRVGRHVALGRLLRFRLVRAALLIGVNLAAVALLAWGFERYLRWRDPFLHKVPFDSAYQLLNLPYYRYLEVPQHSIVVPWGGTQWYTWGHFVTNNSQGFRDRELVTPKPEDSCRIMVLGDSFTWGHGLAIEERYTNLAQASLRQAFPGRHIDVLSFALPAAPTTQERDFLRDHRNTVRPDLVVVGFVDNDPQPTGYLAVGERRFYERYGPLLDRISDRQIRLGLPQTAKLTREALYNAAVATGLIPQWEVGLAETYDEHSAEWQACERALQDIKRMSDEMRLYAPLFVVLNHTIEADRASKYDDPDGGLPRRLRWYHQAERLAAGLGFRTYNHERELLQSVRPQELALNDLDTHPSAKVHRIYAEKLAQVVSTDLRSGQICRQPSGGRSGGGERRVPE